ncbi:hypothetical protein D6C78_05493 [Aureobasidium pullulans]|uniref:Uncharacterized protein n=1 Tax=Aureobasidium pullulans TaxID=5580 RepID=A0A4T0BQI9_AURPU|nr:hypothetical protein D6C78_05493 [Aureobasidium pullulans]
MERSGLGKDDGIDPEERRNPHQQRTANGQRVEETLPRDTTYMEVPGRIPMAVWLIATTSLWERFAYYSFIGPLQNYIQNRFHDPTVPGALGLGEAKASLLVYYLTTTGAPLRPYQRGAYSRSGDERILLVRARPLVKLMCVNIGALSRIPATFIERSSGFWAVNLMSTSALFVALSVFCCGKRTFIFPEVQPNMLPKLWDVLTITVKSGFNINAARPEKIFWHVNRHVEWTSEFIEEVKTGLLACRIFVPFIFLILCQNQMSTNTVSQAGETETHGIPNDLLPSLNSLTVILTMPILSRIVYPVLLRAGVSFLPLTSMAFGFGLQTLGIAYTAGLQGWIYSSPPCYSKPRSCAASEHGALPNRVSVLAQIPVYVILGLSEAFIYPASYAFAYNQAPTSMKSLVQSILLLCFAVGTILGLALSPVYHDPYLLSIYASLAGVMFLITIIFACLVLRK